MFIYAAVETGRVLDAVVHGIYFSQIIAITVCPRTSDSSDIYCIR